MSNRSCISVLILIALLSWGGLLVFTYIVPTGTALAFIAVCLILAVALTSTVAPIAYLITRQFFSAQPTLRRAIQQGALVALLIVLNLMLSAWRSWNVLTALLTVFAVVVVGVIALARK
jgi:hypothetical protein